MEPHVVDEYKKPVCRDSRPLVLQRETKRKSEGGRERQREMEREISCLMIFWFMRPS